jgi:hypothetical protein
VIIVRELHLLDSSLSPFFLLTFRSGVGGSLPKHQEGLLRPLQQGESRSQGGRIKGETSRLRKEGREGGRKGGREGGRDRRER